MKRLSLHNPEMSLKLPQKTKVYKVAFYDAMLNYFLSI